MRKLRTNYTQPAWYTIQVERQAREGRRSVDRVEWWSGRCINAGGSVLPVALVNSWSTKVPRWASAQGRAPVENIITSGATRRVAQPQYWQPRSRVTRCHLRRIATLFQRRSRSQTVAVHDLTASQTSNLITEKEQSRECTTVRVMMMTTMRHVGWSVTPL